MSHCTRQTGRSTRAWERAISIAESGEMVLFIVPNMYLVSQLSRTDKPETLLLMSVDQVTHRGSYNLRDIIHSGVYRPVGTNVEYKVIVDHYAIETHFAAVLEELHRYDK